MPVKAPGLAPTDPLDVARLFEVDAEATTRAAADSALDVRLSTAETDIDALEAASVSSDFLPVGNGDTLTANRAHRVDTVTGATVRTSNGTDYSSVLLTLADAADGSFVDLAIPGPGYAAIASTSVAGQDVGVTEVVIPITGIDADVAVPVRLERIAGEWRWTTATQASSGTRMISPRDYGAALDGSTNDAAAWQALLADLPASGSATIFLDGISNVVDYRIILPSGDMSVSILGSGFKSGFRFVGAGSGLAWGNYSGDDGTPGQLTGNVPRGTSLSNFYILALPEVVYPLWVGYIGHAYLSHVFVWGGVNGAYLSQTQDSVFDHLIVNTNLVDATTGVTINHGANGNEFFGLFPINCTRQVHVKSDDTTSSGAVNVSGPGKNRFVACRFDHPSEFTTELILIESGQGNEFIHCRYNMGASAVGDTPIFRVIAPTGTTSAQKGTKVIGGFLRATSAVAATTYLLDQASGSGTAVEMRGATVENIDATPMVRAVGVTPIIGDMLWTDGAPTAAALGDALEVRSLPVAAHEMLRARGWEGDVQITRLGGGTKSLYTGGGTMRQYVGDTVEEATVAAASPISFIPIQADGTTDAAVTELDTSQWDNAGTLTAISGTGGYVYRLYLDPTADQWYALYPHAEYLNVTLAGDMNAMEDDRPIPAALDGFVLVAALAFYANTTNFNTYNTARLTRFINP